MSQSYFDVFRNDAPGPGVKEQLGYKDDQGIFSAALGFSWAANNLGVSLFHKMLREVGYKDEIVDPEEVKALGFGDIKKPITRIMLNYRIKARAAEENLARVAQIRGEEGAFLWTKTMTGLLLGGIADPASLALSITGAGAVGVVASKVPFIARGLMSGRKLVKLGTKVGTAGVTEGAINIGIGRQLAKDLDREYTTFEAFADGALGVVLGGVGFPGMRRLRAAGVKTESPAAKPFRNTTSEQLEFGLEPIKRDPTANEVELPKGQMNIDFGAETVRTKAKLSPLPKPIERPIAGLLPAPKPVAGLLPAPKPVAGLLPSPRADIMNLEGDSRSVRGIIESFYERVVKSDAVLFRKAFKAIRDFKRDTNTKFDKGLVPITRLPKEIQEELHKGFRKLGLKGAPDRLYLGNEKNPFIQPFNRDSGNPTDVAGTPWELIDAMSDKDYDVYKKHKAVKSIVKGLFDETDEGLVPSSTNTINEYLTPQEVSLHNYKEALFLREELSKWLYKDQHALWDSINGLDANDWDQRAFRRELRNTFGLLGRQIKRGRMHDVMPLYDQFFRLMDAARRGDMTAIRPSEEILKADDLLSKYTFGIRNNQKSIDKALSFLDKSGAINSEAAEDFRSILRAVKVAQDEGGFLTSARLLRELEEAMVPVLERLPTADRFDIVDQKIWLNHLLPQAGARHQAKFIQNLDSATKNIFGLEGADPRAAARRLHTEVEHMQYKIQKRSKFTLEKTMEVFNEVARALLNTNRPSRYTQELKELITDLKGVPNLNEFQSAVLRTSESILEKAQYSDPAWHRWAVRQTENTSDIVKSKAFSFSESMKKVLDSDFYKKYPKAYSNFFMGAYLNRALTYIKMAEYKQRFSDIQANSRFQEFAQKREIQSLMKSLETFDVSNIHSVAPTKALKKAFEEVLRDPKKLEIFNTSPVEVGTATLNSVNEDLIELLFLKNKVKRFDGVLSSDPQNQQFIRKGEKLNVINKLKQTFNTGQSFKFNEIPASKRLGTFSAPLGKTTEDGYLKLTFERNRVHIDMILVSKALRGKGTAAKALKELTDFSEANGYVVVGAPIHIGAKKANLQAGMMPQPFSDKFIKDVYVPTVFRDSETQLHVREGRKMAIQKQQGEDALDVVPVSGKVIGTENGQALIEFITTLQDLTNIRARADFDLPNNFDALYPNKGFFHFIETLEANWARYLDFYDQSRNGLLAIVPDLGLPTSTGPLDIRSTDIKTFMETFLSGHLTLKNGDKVKVPTGAMLELKSLLFGVPREELFNNGRLTPLFFEYKDLLESFSAENITSFSYLINNFVKNAPIKESTGAPSISKAVKNLGAIGDDIGSNKRLMQYLDNPAAIDKIDWARYKQYAIHDAEFYTIFLGLLKEGAENDWPVAKLKKELFRRMGSYMDIGDN